MRIASDYSINNYILHEISEIIKDFNIIVSKRILQDFPKEFLKDSIPNKCRFCGRSFPKVSFNSEAHSIPQFIGNKSLISLFECDPCNKEYFNSFENEFANFMLPHNAMSGTKTRKNKITKYKQVGQPLIKSNNEKILLESVPDSIINKSEADRFEIKVKIPSFIPEYIYRCLVKIALSIIPEDKLTNYKGTIKWLMNREIESNLKPAMLFSMYPFHIQSNEIRCVVLERKDISNKNVPHSIFFLSYNNFAFQTYIPFNSKEKIGIKLKSFPFVFPMTIDLNIEYSGLKTLNFIDLSSKEKKTDEIITYTILGERSILDKNNGG